MAWNQNNQKGNGSNGGNKDFNIVKNWGLRCFEMKQTNSGNIILKCGMNGKKMDNGEYPPTLYVDVMCSIAQGSKNPTDIAEDDYTNTLVNVDGRITISGYERKEGGVGQQITIFADKVTKSDFNK